MLRFQRVRSVIGTSLSFLKYECRTHAQLDHGMNLRCQRKVPGLMSISSLR